MLDILGNKGLPTVPVTKKPDLEQNVFQIEYVPKYGLKLQNND